jgi:hypothetical protein
MRPKLARRSGWQGKHHPTGCRKNERQNPPSIAGLFPIGMPGDRTSKPLSVLSKQPRPKGPRLAVVSNAGGPGVLATDALVTEGGEVARLSEETLQKLDEILPSHWSRNNPVDVLGDVDAARYGKAIEIVSSDPNNDGILANRNSTEDDGCDGCCQRATEV